MSKEEKRMDFKPLPTHSHPNWVLYNTLPLPQGRAGDSECAHGGQDKVNFPTRQTPMQAGFGETPSWAFTQISCFMGNEVKSGVFGITV